MCGRFSLSINNLNELAHRFHVSAPEINWAPRYNIAPTQPILSIVTLKGERQIFPMAWGLIPHWSKTARADFSLINLRNESLIEKPAFRHYLEKQRCLIPADGFFEWKKTKEGKIPFRIVLKHDPLFAFAGLWDKWQDPKGKWIYSCTLITTDANETLAPIHNRMPVILSHTAEKEWLNPNLTDATHLHTLLMPYPARETQVYQVSPLVNSWKNDVPECLQAKNPA